MLLCVSCLLWAWHLEFQCPAPAVHMSKILSCELPRCIQSVWMLDRLRKESMYECLCDGLHEALSKKFHPFVTSRLTVVFSHNCPGERDNWWLTLYYTSYPSFSELKAVLQRSPIRFRGNRSDLPSCIEDPSSGEGQRGLLKSCS